MKRDFLPKILAVLVAVLISTFAFGANETSCAAGGACQGQGGNGGNGGGGGNGGASSSISGSVAVSGSSSHSNATGGDSNASGGTASAVAGSASAGNGSVSNSVTTGNVRALSLGAAAVGSPDAGTCVATLAIGFGLITSPVQIKSCVAAQQAILLNSFGLRDAAIARLCQEDEIYATGICPPKHKQDVVTQND